MNIESNVQSDVIFHRIVVPHDLTGHGDRAVKLAATMAHPLRSKVVLIHVIDPSEWRERPHSMSRADDLARDQWRVLQSAAKRFLPADVKSEVLILSGDPQNVILTETRKLGADLLIITTHPFTGAGYPFTGAEIERIQMKAPCPVMTVEVSEEDEVSLAREEMRKTETHNLRQYCELSRLLSKRVSDRPVYIGYSRLPGDPSGVCH